MRFPRSSGILLHPTSLPGRFGIGDLGPGAHEFVDFLAESGQRWWQVLPLGPTGGMNSPYQSHSSFAGNPLLISPEAMVERGWLRASDLNDLADACRPIRSISSQVARSQGRPASPGLSRPFPCDDPGFRSSSTASSGWLDDYALFMAIKEAIGGKPWYRVGARAGGAQPSGAGEVARQAGREHSLSTSSSSTSSRSRCRPCASNVPKKAVEADRRHPDLRRA